MSLEDRINEMRDYPAADEPTYTPKTEFDFGTGGYIQTGPLREQPQDHQKILLEFGYDPAVVEIVGHPRISRWQQRARIRGTNDYETVWLSAYRFAIAARASSAQRGDLEAIVKRAKAGAKPATGGHWFIFQASDLQLGKRSAAGSTDQIVERFVESVAAARAEFKNLKRHGIAGVQISMPGDCIEGSVSQGGRNLGYLTENSVPEQTRILRRLMLHAIDTFAPLVEQVYLDVVNGNHDTAQRQLNSWPGDGWATESAIAVDDALTLNPTAFSHVTVRVPDQWQGHMTVPLGDSIVTIAHGHQWRRGAGMTWWASQAHNGHPAGGAHVLQCGHHHEWHIETSATKTLVQSSTFDCGSDWFKERTGGEARRGGLVYLLRAGEVSRMSLL